MQSVFCLKSKIEIGIKKSVNRVILLSEKALFQNAECLLGILSIMRYILRRLNKFKHVFRRVQAVKKSVRNTVIPIYGN